MAVRMSPPNPLISPKASPKPIPQGIIRLKTAQTRTAERVLIFCWLIFMPSATEQQIACKRTAMSKVTKRSTVGIRPIDIPSNSVCIPNVTTNITLCKSDFASARWLCEWPEPEFDLCSFASSVTLLLEGLTLAAAPDRRFSCDS